MADGSSLHNAPSPTGTRARVATRSRSRLLLGATLSVLLTGSLLCSPIAPASAADTASAASATFTTAPIADAPSATTQPATTLPASVPIADGTIVRDGVGYLATTNGERRTATVISFDPSIGGNGTTIPTTISGFGHEYTVTAIGRRAFMATGLVEVRLPASITTIGPDAFSDNPGLRAVTISGVISSIEPAKSSHRSFDRSTVITYPAELDSEIIGRSGFSHPQWKGYDSQYSLPVPAQARITVDHEAPLGTGGTADAKAATSTDGGSSTLGDASRSATVSVEVTPQISGVVASGTVQVTIRHSAKAKKPSGSKTKKPNPPKPTTDTIRLTLDTGGIASTRLTLPRGSETIEVTADYLGDGTVEATTATTRTAVTSQPASHHDPDGAAAHGTTGDSSASGNETQGESTGERSATSQHNRTARTR